MRNFIQSLFAFLMVNMKLVKLDSILREQLKKLIEVPAWCRVN